MSKTFNHSTKLATHSSVLRIVDELGAERIHFVCAPTCKKETWEDMVSLFNLIIEVWGEKAKDEVGDIWNFATDGDHLRRLNSVQETKSTLFSQTSPVIALFCDMSSASRWIMAVSLGLCASADAFYFYQASTRHQSSLLNPDDPQDVPWAIDLPEAMVALRLKFMSNQLYGDSQSMVKNIVFTVAKQQELDPSSEVNAYHDGTDPVENRAILKSNPEIDFLRPHGDGIYPRIAEGVDRPLPAAPTTTSPESSAASTDITSPSETDLHAPSLSASDPGYIDDLMPDPNIPIISFEEVLQSGEPEPAVLKLEPRTGVRSHDYLRDGDGKFIHKASICRLVLNKDFIAKSKNRGERAMGLAIKMVRTYTKPNGIQSLSGSITGASFITGDPFATLVRTSTNKSPLMVDEYPTSISTQSKNPKANVKPTGQILRLKAVAASSDDTAVESGGAADDSTWTWLWMGSYLMGKSTIKNTQISMDAPHTQSVFSDTRLSFASLRKCATKDYRLHTCSMRTEIKIFLANAPKLK
ncbi:hypothetical protein B0H13DRAFT_1919986 [Mycena leptocephala]|nr:hypothetical protein B0H13DRAFT_1919986 [Mycena leptocephala]